MATENREIRGWILKICQRADPYGASYSVIESTLLEMGFHLSINEIKSHLIYMTNKGYLKYKEYSAEGVKRRINYVTPKGVDLIEGNIEGDPGVMVLG